MSLLPFFYVRCQMIVDFIKFSERRIRIPLSYLLGVDSRIFIQIYVLISDISSHAYLVFCSSLCILQLDRSCYLGMELPFPFCQNFLIPWKYNQFICYERRKSRFRIGPTVIYQASSYDTRCAPFQSFIGHHIQCFSTVCYFIYYGYKFAGNFWGHWYFPNGRLK